MKQASILKNRMIVYGRILLILSISINSVKWGYANSNPVHKDSPDFFALHHEMVDGEPALSSSSMGMTGGFTYKGVDESDVFVEIQDDFHIEYYSNKKYKIVSKIVWGSPNEFNLVILDNTLPDSEIEIGDEMEMVITKKKNNNIYYKSTVQGYKWKGCLVKVN